MPHLISLSFRKNGAEEEYWDTVVGNHTIEQCPIKGDYPKEIVLSRARSYINTRLNANYLHLIVCTSIVMRIAYQ